MKTIEKIKNIMKKLITIIIITLGLQSYAQDSDNLIVLVGYKSAEIGYSYNNEEFLNFGVSVSVTDSNKMENRANKNDIYKKVHEFNNKITPAVFGLIGASFQTLTITGKFGATYLDQKINDIQDKQKIYFAVGIMGSYEINENFSFVGSYDNVSAVQLGAIYKF